MNSIIKIFSIIPIMTACYNMLLIKSSDMSALAGVIILCSVSIIVSNTGIKDDKDI